MNMCPPFRQFDLWLASKIESPDFPVGPDGKANDWRRMELKRCLA
jgi:hypothetical protein